MVGRMAFALSVQFCAMVAWSVAVLADPVRFASAPAPPTAFAQRQAELRGTVTPTRPGNPIAGDLYRPEGAGPFLAIVALHGCEGWPHSSDGRRRQAARYVAQGYAFLLVDSFGPRGIEQACVPTPGNAPMDRLGDAYGALDWLAAEPFVDPARIALLGASQGGNVVLLAFSPSGSALAAGLAPGHRFAAGVAFYPACSPAAAVSSAPLLVLVGALDDWTPASDCQAMAALPHTGAPERVIVFPGANHAFNGEGVRAHPREVFGHHLEYDEAATRAANAAVAEFLAVAFKR